VSYRFFRWPSGGQTDRLHGTLQVLRARASGCTLPLMSPQGKRVLLVDDNEDARELLAGLLAVQGYVVEVASDAPSALEVAGRWQPQVIVLDLGLPGIDGWELARRLRAMEALSEIRIIALTGYGSERDRERSREAGIDEHLLKPIELAQLTRFFE
jgi:CheY-like chemotaxis protein